MRIRTRSLLPLLVAGALALGAVAGYEGRPLVTKDGIALKGWLIAEGYSGACRTVQDKSSARAAFVEARSRIAAAFFPSYAEAHTGCRLLGVRSQRNLIVNAGEAFLVDAWQNSVELEIMKYHGVGTGATAAAEGDTALGTEATTTINPDSTRATGTLAEASASVFRTVGTVAFDGAAAITEWGLFSQAATGGGTLWSRVVFSAINVASADSILFTYDLTVE